MLVLSRKSNESIVINDDIVITIVEIRGDKVRLGIVAPKDVPVHRQEVYEAILGRTLHKASFRRALQSARLVTPTREWRSEGRGRPAQLYRFVARAPKASRRGVRFDWLTS